MMPTRSLHIEFTYPFSSATNTSLWWSINDGVVGKISDLIGVRAGGDRFTLVRIPLAIASIYGHWVTTYYSHEIAHRQQDTYHSGNYISFFVWEWAHWPAGAPRLVCLNCTNKDYLRKAAQGLNQQQGNATFLYEETSRMGSITFDQGIGYLMNQASVLPYFVIASRLPVDDIDLLTSYPLNRDKGKWIAASVVSTALSIRSMESLYAIGSYLFKGRRRTDLLHIPIGDTRLYPPNLSVLPYPGGLYLSASMLWANLFGQGDTLTVNAGGGIVGDGTGHMGFKISRWRPWGGSRWYIHTIDCGGAFSIYETRRRFTPSNDRRAKDPSTGGVVSLEYERWEPEEGPRVGFHAELGLFLGGEAWRVGAVGIYQDNDLMRNYIDGQRNGWNGWVETTLSY